VDVSRSGPILRVAAAAALVSAAGSCAKTTLPPVSASGAAFEPARDERRLWEVAREEERKLREKVKLYQDPLLEDYLEEVVGRLNPRGMAENPDLQYRVSVIEDPTLNAFAYPHGSLYIHTGLLARVENEDQLATVLGHEMTHVENRHMLRSQRSARNKQLGFGIASIAAAVIVAGEEGEAIERGDYGKAARIDVLSNVLVGLGLQLAVLAAINGYGRDLEREADFGGFEKMAAAGYDPAEAPAIYEALRDDHGESGKLETFFFGNHPRLAARIESAEEWLAAHPATTRPARAGEVDRFARRIRPVVRDDARLNLELGRLKLAEDQLNRALAMASDDPETHFLLARLRLQQSEGEKDPERRKDLQRQAEASLHEAVRLDPDRPGPHRELGLLAFRNEDFRAACVHFRHYLELDPKAEDAGRIRDYVLELERDGHCG
jgi:predicted Zn-dependent protease